MPVDMSRINAFRARIDARFGKDLGDKLEAISRHISKSKYEREGGEWTATQNGQPVSLHWHGVYGREILPLFDAAKEMGLNITIS